ncbi:hypothetical protein DFP72DRAFT_1171915 [Ephemerocybe angulata]|uniref:UBA domain-containing protein n=1 Tax=Ephemerocybe angulata TaxID=980116 RepID=A0A8H6HSS2_9AGAR|nr:hypothetical protein DFP72DRAFT_1171915 [Tulosesus angulatus]
MNVEGEGEGKTEYEEVELTKCLDGLLGTEALEYACPACAKNVADEVRVVPRSVGRTAKKFQLVNWVPAKLDIPIILPPDNVLEFTEAHLGTGLKDGEEPLPEDTGNASAGGGCRSSMRLRWSSCRLMGFPLVWCQKALMATGNADAEAAMGWLFEHMEDADIDCPIVVKAGSGGAGGGAEPSARWWGC